MTIEDLVSEIVEGNRKKFVNIEINFCYSLGMKISFQVAINLQMLQKLERQSVELFIRMVLY